MYWCYYNKRFEIENATLLCAPHHGSWNTAEGNIPKTKTLVLTKYLNTVQSLKGYHIISSDLYSTYKHPSQKYVDKVLDRFNSSSEDNNCNEHFFYQYTTAKSSPQFKKTQKRLFTTRDSLDGTTERRVSYMYMYPSTPRPTFYPYLPGNPYETQFIESTQPAASLNAAFIFEHRGHTLWK